MTKMTTAILVAAGFILGGPAAAGDAAAGKELAMGSCADCHGEDGAGDEDYPAVAGMAEADFIKAMKAYADGTNKASPKMTKEAKKLNDTQLADLAAYYASLK
jgi:cytochrome c553